MTLELYPFRYRDPLTGKWIRARYIAERYVLAERYAEWEIIAPPEIRSGDATMFSPWSNAARHPAGHSPPVEDDPPPDHGPTPDPAPIEQPPPMEDAIEPCFCVGTLPIARDVDDSHRCKMQPDYISGSCNGVAIELFTRRTSSAVRSTFD